MAQQLPHVIPSIYLANYLNDFEPLFPPLRRNAAEVL